MTETPDDAERPNSAPTPESGAAPGASPATAPWGGAPTAVYFDGRSNRRRRVSLRFGAGGLDLIEQGRSVDRWPYEAMRRVDGPPALLRLSSTAALPLARLEIADATTQQTLVARCGALDRDRGPPQTWRIVGWSLAAVASIIAVVTFGLPLVADRLVPLVPKRVEARIGDAVDRQVRTIFGGKECKGREGEAAFTTLVDKLKVAGGIDGALDARVIDTKVPNAFALPGGKVYLTSGLLRRADDPDEIAGVIAHELGHVQHRDGLRRIVQAGGSSFLIGLLFGDVAGGGAVIFTARALFDASYSRDAERGADAFAIDTMHKLGRSPRPMGELLFRITGAQGGGLTILASHPLTEDRLATMKAADQAATGAPILTPHEWTALKEICAAIPGTEPSRHSPPRANPPPNGQSSSGGTASSAPTAPPSGPAGSPAAAKVDHGESGGHGPN